MESRIRTAEVVAALSLATDIGTGQALEHGLGVAVLAVALGEAAGFDEDELARAWYDALLRHVGCTADSHVLGPLVGDEIAFRRGAARVDTTSPAALMPFMVRHLVRTTGPLGATARLGRMAAAPRLLHEGARAVCEVAAQLARRVGLPPSVGADLVLSSERWDGRGFLRRAAGEAVPRPIRAVQVAETARVAHAWRGVHAAVAVVRERAGGALDPGLAARFCAAGPGLLARLDPPSLWEAALACEPGPRPRRVEPVGDTVFVEGVWSGTQTGPLATPDGELPASGRRVSVPFALVLTIRNGRIATVRNYHDRLDFLAQLGLAPAP